MARVRHDWEEDEQHDEAPGGPGAHSWEDVRDDVHGDADLDSESSSEDAMPSTWDAFGEFAVDLLLLRVLNAKQFCLLMWYAWKAGLESAKPFAFRPRAPSGHYNRHVRKTVHKMFNENTFLYRAEVPGSSKHVVGRSTHTLHFAPPHEALDADLKLDAGSYLKLSEAIEDRKFPKAYYNHTLVQQYGSEELILPVSMFVDAVPYSNTDGVIGWWLINMLSGKRYLFATLRKTVTCQCGCKGWCTFNAVWSIVLYFLEAMASRIFPTHRHDCKPFHPDEADRAAIAGTRMQFRMCLLWVKGDWSEYVSTIGFPGWKDILRPCFCCNGCSQDLCAHLGCSRLNLVWRVNGDDDYEVGCQRCEINIVIDRSTRDALVPLLRFDMRQHGVGGRILTADFPSLGLLRDDRLELTRFFCF